MLTKEINSESTGVAISSSSSICLTKDSYIATFFENKWGREHIGNIKLWFLATSPLKVSILYTSNDNITIIFSLKQTVITIDKLISFNTSLLKYVDSVLSAIDIEFQENNHVPLPPISSDINTELICVLKGDKPEKG